jgi:hypothetical protein
MKTLVAVLLAMTLAGSLAAQDHSAHAAAAKPATMMTGMGDLHHPVSTKNADAQAFFDQGLRLIYAFNHDEAARSFQRAADRDPKLAMAYWGIAEAVGPNYNDPAIEERFKQAHDAIRKPWTFLPARPPLSRTTSTRWRNDFRQTPRQICAKRPRLPRCHARSREEVSRRP